MTTARLCLLGTVAALTWPSSALAVNGATFVSQSVPSSVPRGSTFSVEVTFQNTGDTTWTAPAGHCLGSEHPRDNSTWGTNRMFFAAQATDSVAPGASYTFRATLAAPATEGDYDFQWQMLQDAVEWFGATSDLLTLHVTAPTLPPLSCDGREVVCLDLKSAAAVAASGGTVVGGDFDGWGFEPSNQGGIDWDFDAGRDLSAGRMEVLVTGLLPLPGDEGSGGKVSIFDLCGTGTQGNEGVGLQKMDESYRDGHIFRLGMDDDGLADNWDAAIITGADFGNYYSIKDWKAGETHLVAAAWSRAGVELWVDSSHFSSWGNGDTFDPVTKVFTLAARCTHYANQHAVARFSNFHLWAEGTCGNGKVDSGEACDGNCPTACADADACTADTLTGSAQTCDAACSHTPIAACASGDGCCPLGCTNASDSDCPVTSLCGNGKVDSGETCDGNCPTTCADTDACTVDALAGSATNCTAACGHAAVTACTPGDGCCPSGCVSPADSDCPAVPPDCGNGKLDTGETCDGDCPASCDDKTACTNDTLTGTAAACNVSCSHTMITACVGGDGCCPSACTSSTDSDCEKKPLPPTGNGACGCAVAGAPAAAWLGAIVALALCRRRRV